MRERRAVTDPYWSYSGELSSAFWAGPGRPVGGTVSKKWKLM